MHSPRFADTRIPPWTNSFISISDQQQLNLLPPPSRRSPGFAPSFPSLEATQNPGSRSTSNGARPVTLFSAGGNLGPDLTSYQRDQTDTLLLSIINPSAEIRSGYEMVTVKTIDGRTLSGFLARNEIEMLSLRIIGGNEVILRRDELLSIELQPGSLMPAGLLNGLSDSQLQDLWSYLRSPQPLSLN